MFYVNSAAVWVCIAMLVSWSTLSSQTTFFHLSGIHFSMSIKKHKITTSVPACTTYAHQTTAAPTLLINEPLAAFLMLEGMDV